MLWQRLSAMLWHRASVPVVLALRITNPAGTETCRYRTGYFDDTA